MYLKTGSNQHIFTKKCRQLLGASTLDPHKGFVPESHCGTAPRRPPEGPESHSCPQHFKWSSAAYDSVKCGELTLNVVYHVKHKMCSVIPISATNSPYSAALGCEVCRAFTHDLGFCTTPFCVPLQSREWVTQSDP